ncbi:Armadillo repeat-containing protein LFR [Camellia lanceoleosa]|uniref:Armadillo repeat-containing protein LFR n=1 Tax=Camellia lanceoleosa TaxID=1840588 RepID=A0ACC0HJ14_9ERIC|nr:Armadillo repeat-containing protein LFR [Camellia lanceoleosa]
MLIQKLVEPASDSTDQQQRSSKLRHWFSSGDVKLWFDSGDVRLWICFSVSLFLSFRLWEKHAVQAIIGMLKSSVKAWIFGAAKLIGRLIINPDNEPFILPFGPQKCDLRENYEIKETKNVYVDSNESLNGTEGTNSVKVVNGVAVVQGRTRTPVERFERRERLNSDEVQAPDTTPQIIPETAKISPVLNGHPQITERELTSANDGNVAEDLMQNHDVFLSTLRSHLTKLQVVCHFLERNNIKVPTRKMPDHSVQADLISVHVQA